MATLTLYIGPQNYSSWSLRGYLPVAQATDDFELVTVPLFSEGYKEKLAKVTPSGLVPVLHHGEVRIWDSLAITEYIAELYPDAGLWPADRGERALARSVTAEMHGGFLSLRDTMSMNIRARRLGEGHTESTLADIARITAIWRGLRERFGDRGAFLFGGFTAGDCAFAPVVTRFLTYGVEVDQVCRAYIDAVMAHPPMARWCEAAIAEPYRIDKYER